MGVESYPVEEGSANYARCAICTSPFCALHLFITFSGNFNCVVCSIVAFVCLLRELCALRELLYVALTCIDCVVEVGAIVVALWHGLRENLKKLSDVFACMIAHHSIKRVLRS